MLTKPPELFSELTLQNGDTVQVIRVLRQIPKKRLVVLGTCNHSPIVAKIFLQQKSGERAMNREMTGLLLLQKHLIPTPAVLYIGKTLDQRYALILFQALDHAKTFEQCWLEKLSLAAIYPLLKRLIYEIATQHTYGIVQKDMHLRNFLIQDQKIYTIDGASITQKSSPLCRKESLLRITYFLSQLGVGCTREQRTLFEYYAYLRGILLNTADERLFKKIISMDPKKRWKKYQEKIFKRTSQFVPIAAHGYRGMMRQSAIGPEFLQWIQAPDAPFLQGTTVFLKQGRSSTVIQIVLDGECYAIKRYNIKTIFHFLRRMFRKTRARKAWRLAHKLKLFYVPTADPIAFLEKKWFGLNGVSYYVSRYVKTMCNISYCNTYPNRVPRLIQQVADCGITHNDLKLANILINEQAHPLLIDFDGATEHRSKRSLKRALTQSMKRFDKNFSASV